MIKKKGIYQYYVEGDDDKCIVNALKSDLACIASGKVNVFNVVQEKFTNARIRTLKDNTIVVLVYDTDTTSTQILTENIKFLKAQKAVKEVICVPQVQNLEDELVRACGGISTVEQLTHSKTKTDYKRDLIKCTNLEQRLKSAQFDVNKMWCKTPTNSFAQFGNDAEKIKVE